MSTLFKVNDMSVPIRKILAIFFVGFRNIVTFAQPKIKYYKNV